MDRKNENEMSLEECFFEVEGLIEQLEEPDISLEDAFQMYEKGMKKIKECNDKIEKVEKQMITLNELGELEQ